MLSRESGFQKRKTLRSQSP